MTIQKHEENKFMKYLIHCKFYAYLLQCAHSPLAAGTENIIIKGLQQKYDTITLKLLGPAPVLSGSLTVTVA